MDDSTPTSGFVVPSAAHYKFLVDRTTQAIKSLAAGEIDARTFRQRIDGIQAETRTLDFLRKLHRTHSRLAALEQKASKLSVSPSISNVCK